MSKIKTSIHPVKFANTTKKNNLSIFIDEYRRVAQLVVDYIWESEYVWNDKKGEHKFSRSKNQLYFPSMTKGEIVKQAGVETFLTARALKCLLTQVAGMISAEVEKQRKRLYMLQVQKEEGKTKKQRKLLANRIKQNIPVKPNCSNMNAELNSICIDLQETDGEFDEFLRLKSITKDKMEIKLPVKFHKHSRKLARTREQLTSYLISKSKINIRWKKDLPLKRELGEVVGADQGMKDVLTCSNKQVTPKVDKHGHSLKSIMRRLSARKKGSNRFHKTQLHRTNFINWSINQLNFNNVKEVRLERVWNIGYKSGTSRLMSHWTNTLIRDKVESVCEELGV